MNFPTMQKDKETFDGQFFEDEVSQPIVKMNQSDLRIESRENSSLTEMGKKIIPNLLIIIGAFFLYTQTVVNSSHYLLHPDQTMLHPFKSLFCLLGGLFVLFLSLGSIKKKGTWLLYAIIPLMGMLFTLIFNLVPKDLLMTDAFGYSIIFTYPLVLLVFYYLKRYFETSDN